jgi:putative transposase
MPKKPTKKVLFGVQKQQLKHLTVNEYKALKELCFLTKNMYNVALYNVRQYYFTEKKFLSYENNYHLCKINENYSMLNCNSAQQIMKVVDRNFSATCC